MAGAATIRALVNRPRAEREIRGSRARSGSRGSSQDHDGPGLVSDRLYRPRWLGWQLRAGETRPVSNAAVCEEARRAVAAEVGYPAACREEPRNAQGTAR